MYHDSRSNTVTAIDLGYGKESTSHAEEDKEVNTKGNRWTLAQGVKNRDEKSTKEMKVTYL